MKRTRESVVDTLLQVYYYYKDYSDFQMAFDETAEEVRDALLADDEFFAEYYNYIVYFLNTKKISIDAWLRNLGQK